MISATSLNALSGRILALSVLGVVAGGLVFAVAQPIAIWDSDRRDQYQKAQVELARMRTVTASRPKLQQALEDIERSDAMTRGVVPAAGLSLATAALQAHVIDIVKEEGATLHNVRPRDSADDGVPQWIGLRFEFTADGDGVRRIIHALEDGFPLVRFANLELRASQPYGQVSSETVIPIDVRADVEAIFMEEAE